LTSVHLAVPIHLSYLFGLWQRDQALRVKSVYVYIYIYIKQTTTPTNIPSPDDEDKYVGRLKSNAHMLVEREQKQIARSGKKYMKVQFLSFKSIYLL
jgi:hypothetical protein